MSDSAISVLEFAHHLNWEAEFSADSVHELWTEIDTRNARIAELEALIGKLIEIGEWGLTGMVIAASFSGGEMYELAKRHQDDWYSLVKGWKEREE